MTEAIKSKKMDKGDWIAAGVTILSFAALGLFAGLIW